MRHHPDFPYLSAQRDAPGRTLKATPAEQPLDTPRIPGKVASLRQD
jgi:hypothetical protein